MIIHNEDVKKLIVEIPEGHEHVRTSFILHDGSEITLLEATVANLLRAYLNVKTHPSATRAVLRGGKLHARKKGFAEWQLLEETV